MAEITVPARVDCLNTVLDFIESAARDAEIDGKQRNNIKIAVEEIFVNIASYAYPSGEGDVTVSLPRNPDKLVMEFRDSGTPYNPLAKADPDTSLSAGEREIGGLGIFMVRKMMDDVKYRYEDGKNILTIEKHIGTGGDGNA